MAKNLQFWGGGFSFVAKFQQRSVCVGTFLEIWFNFEKKVMKKFLGLAATLMFTFSGAFAQMQFEDAGSAKALYGNAAGTKFCCKGSGSGCSAADC